MSSDDTPWQVPVRVEDVPESGRHVRLNADAATCQAIAKAIGILGVARLQAAFDVTRQGRAGLRVTGDLSATVTQACVVTLEPVPGEVEEEVDLRFSSDPRETTVEGEQMEVAEVDPPEPLVGGAVDLGAIAVEFLALGLDPYPRKPGAVFQAPAADDGPLNPFAALAALKDKAGGAGD